jgi:hypothetical protein
MEDRKKSGNAKRDVRSEADHSPPAGGTSQQDEGEMRCGAPLPISRFHGGGEFLKDIAEGI